MIIAICNFSPFLGKLEPLNDINNAIQMWLISSQIKQYTCNMLVFRTSTSRRPVHVKDSRSFDACSWEARWNAWSQLVTHSETFDWGCSVRPKLPFLHQMFNSCSENGDFQALQSWCRCLCIVPFETDHVTLDPHQSGKNLTFIESSG